LIVYLFVLKTAHIASLFPPVVDEAFSTAGALTLHTQTQRFAVLDRITVNFKFLQEQQPSCEYLIFMNGQDKKQVWDEMMQYYNEKKSSEDLQQMLKKYPALSVTQKQTTTAYLLVPAK